MTKDNNLEKISLGQMFAIFFKIAAFTFGGGYTIVPVMKDEFSEKRNLIDQDIMLDIVSIATSGPGPMAINCSILIGYKLHGILGAIMAAIASALPSLIIITIVSYFYKEFSENYFIQAALTGMGGMIAAVLFWTAISMVRQALEENTKISALIMVSAFLASFVFNINTGIIMLVVAIFSLAIYTLIDKHEKLGGEK